MQSNVSVTAPGSITIENNGSVVCEGANLNGAFISGTGTFSSLANSNVYLDYVTGNPTADFINSTVDGNIRTSTKSFNALTNFNLFSKINITSLGAGFPVTMQNLSIDVPLNCTITTGLTMSGNFYILSGTTSIGANILNVGGDFADGGALSIGAAGALNFTGTGKIMSAANNSVNPFDNVCTDCDPTYMGWSYSATAAPFTVTAATNPASPIEITTSVAHGLVTGQEVNIAGVLGNTAANGVWTITVTSATQFTLNNSTSNGNRTGGGTVTPYTWIVTTSRAGGKSNPRSFQKELYLEYGQTNQWVFTGGTNLTAGRTYNFSLWYADSLGTGTSSFLVSYGAAATAAGMTTAIIASTNVTSSGYNQAIGTITPGASGTYYIGIKGTTPAGDGLYIDDVYLTTNALTGPFIPLANFNISSGGTVLLQDPAYIDPAIGNGILQLSNGAFSTGNNFTVNNNSTIQISNGILADLPNFINTVNINYSPNTAPGIFTRAELPNSATAGKLNNLTVNNTGGVTLRLALTKGMQ